MTGDLRRICSFLVWYLTLVCSAILKVLWFLFDFLFVYNVGLSYSFCILLYGSVFRFIPLCSVLVLFVSNFP